MLVIDAQVTSHLDDRSRSVHGFTPVIILLAASLGL
jgi:hypothetical protein